jgi:hypothetical protein
MNTYYAHNGRGEWVRYFYDTSITLWTVYQVTAPNDEADQIGDVDYCIKQDLAHTIRNILECRNPTQVI